MLPQLLCCSWETTPVKGVRERKQGGFILSYFKAVSIYLPLLLLALQEGSLLCPGGWAEGNEILIQSRFCCLSEPVGSVLPAIACREVLFPSQTYPKLNKQILPVMSFLIIPLPKKGDDSRTGYPCSLVDCFIKQLCNRRRTFMLFRLKNNPVPGLFWAGEWLLILTLVKR